jgi:hypothetical protein
MQISVVLMLSSALFLPIRAGATTTRGTATITTTTGEVVEGTLLGVVRTDVEVEVGARITKIPLATVRYISFGDVAADAARPTPAPIGTLQNVLAGFEELNWGASFVNIEPRIYYFFATSGDDWADVKAWLHRLIQLHNTNSWPPHFDAVAAKRYEDLIRKVSAEPSERTHRETAAIVDLTLDTTISGRLGRGDATLPENVDKGDAGRWADQYRITLSARAGLAITAECLPSDCGLVVLDERGKRVGKEEGFPIDKVFAPGTYTVWVTNREPCVYQLTAWSQK